MDEMDTTDDEGFGRKVAPPKEPLLDRYTLSYTLATADGKAVRSLAVTNGANGCLLAGSQDGILSIYKQQNEGGSVKYGAVVPHEGTRPYTLTALLALPLDTVDGRSWAVSGCRDGTIRLYCGKTLSSFSSSSSSSSPKEGDWTQVATGTGHSMSVTSLSWLRLGSDDDDGCLLSGSYDGSARLWEVSTSLSSPSLHCIQVLPEHENTVSVLGLGCGRMVTASAGVARDGRVVDHKIRMWEVEREKGSNASGLRCRMGGSPTHNHYGPIRGLDCNDNNNEDAVLFASCSNDGTVALRTLADGECVRTLTADPLLLQQQAQQEPSILLDLAVAPDHTVAAGVEEGSMVVWSFPPSSSSASLSTETENAVHHIIRHPGCVWRVLALPNGDLATGCQDGNIRIFTRDPSRVAPLDEIEALEAASAPSQGSGGPSKEEMAKLPRWDDRIRHMGKSEGQVQMFVKVDGGNEVVIAAQWNQGSWVEVGVVTGTGAGSAPDKNNTGTIDGVTYDHVFPVEVDVAGGGVQSLQIGYNNGQNPFVAAQEFIDKHRLDQHNLGQVADYIRQRVGNSVGGAVTLGMDTPSSFASAPNSSSASAPAPPTLETYTHLPFEGPYISFDLSDPKKYLGKVMQKVVDLCGENNDDTILVDSIRVLCDTLIATSRYHSSKVDQTGLDALATLLKRWPLDQLYPVLDLLRVAVLHPDAASTVSSKRRVQYWSDVVESVLHRTDYDFSGGGDTSTVSKTIAAVPLLSVRFLANAYRGGTNTAAAEAIHSRFISSIAPWTAARVLPVLPLPQTKVNKKGADLPLSLATLFLNAAGTSYSQTRRNSSPLSFSSETVVPTLRALLRYRGECTARTLQAVGTLGLALKDVSERTSFLDKFDWTDVATAVDDRNERSSLVLVEVKRVASRTR